MTDLLFIAIAAGFFAASIGLACLRIYMANLRRKLEADPAQPRRLLTETGIGYRFSVD